MKVSMILTVIYNWLKIHRFWVHWLFNANNLYKLNYVLRNLLKWGAGIKKTKSNRLISHNMGLHCQTLVVANDLWISKKINSYLFYLFAINSKHWRFSAKFMDRIITIYLQQFWKKWVKFTMLWVRRQNLINVSNVQEEF